MTIIIGIDPGSRRTGYGVIEIQGYKHRYLTCGYIDVASYAISQRLRHIYLALKEVMQLYNPREAAVEEIFFHENPNSALKLGQARGAAIVALDVPVTEYSAREVKKSIVGNGGARKDQVQFMVKRLLNIHSELEENASDALAVALCHAHARNFKQLIAKR
jgi:crossover junction endodeoxyribonuclease RuvC